MSSGYSTPRRRGVQSTPIERDDTYVYFVRAGEDGLIKIGRTNRPMSDRLKALQTSTAEPLRCLGVIVGEDIGLEGRLHRRFAEFRVRGEWFRPDDSLLEFIAENATDPVEYDVSGTDNRKIKAKLIDRKAINLLRLRMIMEMRRQGWGHAQIAVLFNTTRVTIWRAEKQARKKYGDAVYERLGFSRRPPEPD